MSLARRVPLSTVVNVDHYAQRIKEGYVEELPHPEFPDIVLARYTQKTLDEKKWDSVTLACNGLVFNKVLDDVLYRPQEVVSVVGEDRVVAAMARIRRDRRKPVIAELLPGQFGGVFSFSQRSRSATPYDITKHLEVVTVNGFNSPESIWAKEWLNKAARLRYGAGDLSGYIHEDYSYTIQIVMPNLTSISGVIVVGLRETRNVVEYNPVQVRQAARNLGLRCLQRYAAGLKTLRRKELLIQYGNGINSCLRFTTRDTRALQCLPKQQPTTQLNQLPLL